MIRYRSTAKDSVVLLLNHGHCTRVCMAGVLHQALHGLVTNVPVAAVHRHVVTAPGVVQMPYVMV